MFEGKHSDLTEKIIGAFYQVCGQLGYGFSEKVYENALTLLLKKLGFKAEQQKPILVYFDAQVVGEYYVDILVNEVVILELKACKSLLEEHEAQLLNYLKATSCEVGLLLNFGPKPQVSRKVFDNHRKGSLTWIEPHIRDTNANYD